MTEKQNRFVEEYLIDLNANAATIRAGYSPSYSKLFQDEEVRACIEEKLAERSKRTEIKQDIVVRELARIAFMNASNVIDFGEGTIKEKLSIDDTATFSSVKIKTMKASLQNSNVSAKGEVFEFGINFFDKIKALELLGKHLGMFKGEGQYPDARVGGKALGGSGKALGNEIVKPL